MENKGSIFRKVSRSTQLLSLLSVLLISVLFMCAIIFLRQNTISVSTDLGELAAKDSKDAMEKQTLSQLQTLARSKADLSDEKLRSIQTYVQMMSQNATEIMSNPTMYPSVAIAPPNAENKDIFTAQLLRAKEVSYADIKQETDILGNNASLFLNITLNDENITAAYIGTESGAFLMVDKDSHTKTEIFDPRTRLWYISAKENNGLIWTDVFDDLMGRGLAITCAAPYYKEDGSLAGVAGIGSLLVNLNDTVIETQIGETGYAFVLNDKGQMIISPDIRKDENGNIIRENLLESDKAMLREVAEEMVAGESGIRTIELNGEDFYIAYEPFETLPWSIAAVISADEALRPAVASEKTILGLKNNAVSKINFAIFILAIAVVGVLVILVFVITAYSKRTAKKLTEPILSLTEGAIQIGGGDLDYTFEVSTGDELETLASTFNSMIDNIKSITSEKERISAELNVATTIQASMLPCIFPAFPGRSEFDVYATTLPAKEVGGDFYDFFLIDEDNLAVVIADVSGKGVPAALFMVISKTLIKNNVQSGKTAAQVLETVNNILCENNEADMFVTAFLGILNIPSGRLTYANAGHNPSLIKRVGNEFTLLPTKPGFVLAGMDGILYTEDETTLNKGDLLFMYTDGVTEANNPQNELFGNQRLLDAVNKHSDKEIDYLIHSIKEEIDSFADGAAQADDITMLALLYKL